MMNRLALPTIATVTITTPAISFASTLRRLKLLLASDRCGPVHLAALIGSDPMLTLSVLSKANLSADRSLLPIDALKPAISLLGLNQISSLIQSVKPVNDPMRLGLAAHWGAANACGRMTQLLWGFVKEPARPGISPYLARNAGLLHNIGLIITSLRLSTFCQQAGTLTRDKGMVFPDALRKALGLDAAAIGTLVARSWHLPDSLVNAIRYIHRPTNAPRHAALASMVHVARCLTRGFGFVVDDDPYVEHIDEQAMDLLGLRPADLERTISQFGDQLSDLECFESALSL